MMFARLPSVHRGVTLLGLFALTVVLALAGNALRLAARRYGPDLLAPRPSLHYTPYTVVLHAIHFEKGASSRLAWAETRALRSDGAQVTLLRGEAAGGAYVRRDFILPTGERITLDDVHETKIVYVGSDLLSYSRDPNSDCLNSRTGHRMASREESLLGRGTIGGYQVVYIKTHLATSAYAPSLGCALLYGTTDQSLPQYMEKQLVSISAAEPDSILFAVPPDFLDVRPNGNERNTP